MTDLRKLHEVATPPPWHSPGISLRPFTIYAASDADIARAWSGDDAALIVATRNALPYLLDVVEAARTEVAGLGDRHARDAEVHLLFALEALDAHLRGE
jgi:hypothetical protein